MAFIIRLGTHTARFYRRTEQRVGDGTFKRVTVHLGSLPLTTTELPPDFPKGQSSLTQSERLAMEEKFLKPARAILERRRKEEQERQLDPAHRLAQALSLLSEAATLSHERPAGRETLDKLHGALVSVRCEDPLFVLASVARTARAAAEAADAGTFGTRGDEPMRDTPVAPLWADVTAAVNGSGYGSLIRALQRSKFVKER